MAFKHGFAVAVALASEITARLDLPAAAAYYVPVEAKDAELKVAVAFVGESVEVEDRASNRVQYTIEVAVLKRVLKREDVVELQALIAIVDEIKGLFEEEDESGVDLHRGRLRETVLGNAVWMGTAHEPVFIPEHLEGMKQFSAVPSFTFQRVT
jgi:hypothetical protein